MTRTMRVIVLIIVGFSGCKHASRISTTTLHVLAASSPCDDGAVEASFQGRRYNLLPVESDKLSLGVACFGLIETGDVGKDYTAKIEDGYMVLNNPTVKSSDVEWLHSARQKDYDDFNKKYPSLHRPQSYLVDHPDKFRYEIKRVSEFER